MSTIDKFVNNLREQLNVWTSYIHPPEMDKFTNPTKRKVLVIHAHPNPQSFSAALADAVVSGLKIGGHEIRLRHLYDTKGFDPSKTYNNQTFPPALTCEERQGYHEPDNVRYRHSTAVLTMEKPEVCKAVDDLRWCDSIVFVYPTW